MIDHIISYINWKVSGVTNASERSAPLHVHAWRTSETVRLRAGDRCCGLGEAASALWRMPLSSSAAENSSCMPRLRACSQSSAMPDAPFCSGSDRCAAVLACVAPMGRSEERCRLGWIVGLPCQPTSIKVSTPKLCCGSASAFHDPHAPAQVPSVIIWRSK